MKTRILQDAISGSYTLVIDDLTQKQMSDIAEQGWAYERLQSPQCTVLGRISELLDEELERWEP
ncbi:MAG: hypothetical protein LC650_00570 [Actinobacteria bacterium]|nr:hypothetical protein [Actinomycetota bacterium]